MGAALELIQSLGGQQYTLKRYGAGSYSTSLISGGGLYVPGPVTTQQVWALIQPLTDREALTLSEGDRLRAGFAVWTEEELRVAEENGMKKADVLTIGGEHYEVVRTQKWGGDIPHYRSLVLRLEEQS